MEQQPYDLESVYDEQINPLMAQIIAICKEHNMPFIATFQYATRGEDDHDFCTSGLLPKERTSTQLDQIYRILQPQRAPTMMLITRDKDGKITKMTAILP